MFDIVTVFALLVAYSRPCSDGVAPMLLFNDVTQARISTMLRFNGTVRNISYLFLHKTKQSMHLNRTFSTMQTTQQTIEGK